MRTEGPLGTPADFKRALSYANEGAVVSDTGLSENVEAALDKVRDAAPNPPKRLIDAAIDAYMVGHRPISGLAATLRRFWRTPWLGLRWTGIGEPPGIYSHTAPLMNGDGGGDLVPGSESYAATLGLGPLAIQLFRCTERIILRPEFVGQWSPIWPTDGRILWPMPRRLVEDAFRSSTETMFGLAA